MVRRRHGWGPDFVDEDRFTRLIQDARVGDTEDGARDGGTQDDHPVPVGQVAEATRAEKAAILDTV